MRDDRHTSWLDQKTRIISACDGLELLGPEVALLGAARPLLVTDAGIVAAGHVERALGLLESHVEHVTVFADVSENPTTTDVERCAEALGEREHDIVLALGGGSAMDTAKSVSLLSASDQPLEAYRAPDGEAPAGLLPVIALPTTAGTGSEVQSHALIGRAGDHAKMALRCDAPAVAILDPVLTGSTPRHVAAQAGLDALVHATEAAVTRSSTSFSEMFAREAFCLLHESYEASLEPGSGVDVRGSMLEGAALAGLAIEMSMLGAAHALANPLTRAFDVPHGQAVAAMLPAVVRFNAADARAAGGYLRLARAAGLVGPEADGTQAAEAIALRVEQLYRVGGLAPLAVEAGAVQGLAAEASTQWTGHHNPRRAGEPELAGLYRDALGLPAPA